MTHAQRLVGSRVNTVSISMAGPAPPQTGVYLDAHQAVPGVPSDTHTVPPARLGPLTHGMGAAPPVGQSTGVYRFAVSTVALKSGSTDALRLRQLCDTICTRVALCGSTQLISTGVDLFVTEDAFPADLAHAGPVPLGPGAASAPLTPTVLITVNAVFPCDAGFTRCSVEVRVTGADACLVHSI